MSDISNLFDRCVALHQAGQHSVAAQGYAAILAADPRHADAWHLSGLLAHQAGRSADGLGYIQRAIELNPANAEYRSNVAAILMAQGHWSQALEAAEQAIAVNPSLPAAMFQKGRALARLGQSEVALQSLLEAEALGFDPALVSLETGTVRQAIGDNERSVRAFERSLRIDPSQPAIWLALSRLAATRQYQFSGEQLRQMQVSLNDCRNDKDRARVAFSLAAQFDRAGDAEAAFEHWTIGNEASQSYLRLRGHSFDPDARSRIVHQQAAVFTAEFLNSLQPVNDSSRPIVVVGMPRSGTSLVEQILASHPDVAAGGELTFWSDAMAAQVSADNVQSQRELTTSDWRRSIAEKYDHLLSSMAQTALRIVDKMPGNFLYLGIIATSFPNATIIHCCRDPRDSCLSCYSQLFDDPQLQLSTSRLDWLARQYNDYADLMRHWHRVLPDRIVEVHYEQLIDDPEPQVRRLLQSCRLPWSAECLNFHRTKNTIQTASVVQVRQPLYKTSQGRWLRYETHLSPLIDGLRNVDRVDFDSI